MKHFADIHVHMRNFEPDIARGMLDLIASCGVTDVALQALPKYSVVENLSALYWKLHYDKMCVRAFGGLHQLDQFADEAPEKQAERLLDLGFDGMKFLDMKPDFRKLVGKGLNNPCYDRMFSMLEERGVPVLIHCNDPASFWDITKMSQHEIDRGWFYGDGTHLTYQEIYEETFELLDKHPKLNVTLAHFFFLSERMDEARRVMDKYPNVRFDLTPGYEMYRNFSKDIERWHDFFVEHRDRILFGTDSNSYKNDNDKLNRLVYTTLTHDHSEFPMPTFDHALIRGLALDEDAVEHICGKNYIDFVGEYKPVSEEKFLDAAQRMLDSLKGDNQFKRETDWLNFIL